MISHTPGPWHYSSTHLGVAFDIGADNNDNVAVVFGPKRNGAAEYYANARLIAAAPGLLKAAKDVLCCSALPERWSEPLLAAIAKAEGEAFDAALSNCSVRRAA